MENGDEIDVVIEQVGGDAGGRNDH